MPQAVFQSGWFTSAVAVHGNHNAPGMDMALVSGQLPPSGIPYAITGAYFEYSPQTQGGVEWAFIRRDAWNGPQLGRTVFMAGWCELSHDPAVLLPVGKIYLVGDGGNAGQLQSGSIFKLTITWETTTTACTPPTSVQLDRALAETSATLSWSGAAGGTGNAIRQYAVEYRDSGDGTLWGNWQVLSFVQATTGSASLAVSPPSDPGYQRQYRVATIGTAGVPYASPWADQQPVLRRNSPPATPASLSASPAVWESGNITLTWAASADPDGNLSGYQLVYRSSLDGYATAHVVDGVTGSPHVHAITLQRGEVIQYYLRAVDALGAASGWVASNTITGNQLPDAPSGVTASPALWESGTVTIQWQPASDPDGTVTYQVAASVSSDGSSWGTAQSAGSTTGTSITHTPVLPRGAYIRYSVCAVDALGAASPWVAANLVRRNQLPISPTVDYPVDGAVWPGGRMAYQITVPADPDGGTLSLLMQAGQQWIPLGTSTGGVIRGRLAQPLAGGPHALTFVAQDSLGANSPAVTRQVQVVPAAWTRTITPGVVIANATVSHQADIREMLAAVNRLRANVGLPAIALPGIIGRWADWKGQMQALQSALTAYYQRIGEAAPSWVAVPRYPTAAVINQIREAVKNG